MGTDRGMGASRRSFNCSPHLRRSAWLRVCPQGMQFYNFIFLARSWASDRLHLSKSLSWLARRAEKEDSPLTFILYPEGTLVSKDTRPVSKKYADKLGIVRSPLPLAHTRLQSPLYCSRT